MCGIVGLVNFDSKPVSNELLSRMVSSISHRGPDGKATWYDSNVGLGHSRLSIIDLSINASQPFVSFDGRYIMSYNGEIYNYVQLKKELIKRGYSFRSTSDSEVVLYSYAEWGSNCLNKFNGMFAFSIFDQKTKEIFVARDRYGIKPLYYFEGEKYFAFSSEQRALALLPNFKKQLDLECLYEYLTFQNIFSNKSFLKGIKVLAPGHFLMFNCAQSRPNVRIEKYWDFVFAASGSESEPQEKKRELNYLLEAAVKRQMAGDVEIGSYLSGGIDSGSISALASREIDSLKTFTCGFDLTSASGIELTFDERVKAELMSEFIGSENHQIVLKSGDMEKCISDVVYHLEDPRVGQSYPNYYIAKLASKYVKVVLSGIGGDELFAGYPWRYRGSANSNNFQEFSENYYNIWQRMLTEEDLRRLFSPVSRDVKEVDTKFIFNNVLKQHEIEYDKPSSYVNSCLYFESKTFLHGLLVVEDKLSMAHGLETRVPFLDNDLVDFATGCPLEYKLNSNSSLSPLDENESISKVETYYQRTNEGKKLLREVTKSIVPLEISQGQKQGFSAPDASWFRSNANAFVRKKLLGSNSLISEVLDQRTIEEKIGKHFTGEENKRLLIWSLLNIEEWLQMNLGS